MVGLLKLFSNMYLRDVNLVAKVDIFNGDGILEISKNGIYKPVNPWSKSVSGYIKYSELACSIFFFCSPSWT